MMITRDDKSEKVQYNIVDFPAYIKPGVLSTYPNYSAISHWHDDVEFIAITSGHMLYNVNGEIVRLEEGDGIFVNARQLHYGFSDDQSECIFVCVLLHPMLLCSSRYLEQKYITPVLQNENLPYHLLHHDVLWEQEILQSLLQMQECVSNDLAELKIQSLFYQIWFQLCGHRQLLDKTFVRNHHLSSLKEMVSFIQEHYKEKISLSDIAKAGCVGKTSCCAIFRKFINQTPNIYLTEYRLQKSMELLMDTDLTITEICYDVGFTGASYFTETFRKSFGCTPSEYREK
ncbi:MAG: AraC family transcriptional regulator [Lachnospiraceae bacterium]|nr:AraC family transcriptional regulator [Lachnospiraceae bacterium]